MPIFFRVLTDNGGMFAKVDAGLVVVAEGAGVEDFAHVDCGFGCGVGDDYPAKGAEGGERV